MAGGYAIMFAVVLYVVVVVFESCAIVSSRRPSLSATNIATTTILLL